MRGVTKSISRRTTIGCKSGYSYSYFSFFVIFVNDKELAHFSYIRYIENKVREAFYFKGTPIRFIIRERKEDGKK